MTGIVLVTHAGLGQSLRHQAEVILGHSVPMVTVAVSYGADPDDALNDVILALAQSSDKDGAVILTDLPGATPHNLAARAAAKRALPVISGLNLPMLLKVINHASKPSTELAKLACIGGQQGIINA